MRPWQFLVAAGALACAAALAQLNSPPPASTSAPAASAASSRPVVPDRDLQQMQGFFVPPAGLATREQALASMSRQWRQAVEKGKELEAKYTNAANLGTVRLMMLRAAVSLAATSDDVKSWEREVAAISHRILDSDAPPEQKVNADFFLLRQKLGLAVTAAMTAPAASAPTAPPTAADDLRNLVRQYEKTDADMVALEATVVLARELNLSDLRDEFMSDLQNRHNLPEVRAFLLEQGFFVGKPFKATLTRLDGSVLRLPEDFAGKVVVVDFWATWCGPCVVSTPALKDLYVKYRDRGVEFVGISLDDNKQSLERFIKSEQVSWQQTYTGKRFEDPTALFYGVVAIPATWVLDRKGNVVADSLHPMAPPEKPGSLENAIRRALGLAPLTSQPASAPAQRSP